MSLVFHWGVREIMGLPEDEREAYLGLARELEEDLKQQAGRL